MTLSEVISSDKVMLTPAEIAPILGIDPQLIRVQAHSAPALLGFPVVVAGARTKIPRKAFLKFLQEG